ncbi:outer membrane beta-barrel protein [Mesorhizobium sp. YR577]|uniref:outer membrane protein n=1 Tax=Mesorhizobium sp. YR577 TaxID=1884373 RepID=UPI0008E0CBA8|nr:outer membrane beta-barrel protein [Mesorhizobium sp. YR577]SFT43415.1 Opacity protein [Mesorhizobium sp. YR577]
MKSHGILIFSLAVAAALAGNAANAADYDPPIFVDNAPEYVPVEVGSGWYLRGDLGYSLNKPYDYFETPAGFTSSEIPVSGSIGMGYHFNDYLRGELNFGILPSSKFSNNYTASCDGTQTVTVTDGTGNTSAFAGRSTRDCPSSDNAKNKAYNGMANAYFDLGTFAGFTPYVGGGLGVAYTSYRSAKGDRHCNGSSTSVPNGQGGTTTTIFECDDASTYSGDVTSERQYNLAYSIGAGFNYRISQNTSVDLGYEYYSVPGARYVSYGADGPTFGKGIDYHQLKVGLRYDLW